MIHNMRHALAVAWLFAGAAFGTGLTPYGLECEARRNPVGIDLARPRLSWKLESDERGQRQTAYQIVAGSAPGAADWWDDVGAPGLSHIRIRPEPVGDVTWVKASWEMFRGPVEVSWRIEGGVFHLGVDVPPGMTAEVSAPGLKPVEIGSGHYDFERKNLHQ